MFRKLTLGVCILFVASSAFAANKEQERLENSGTVLQEVMDVPDNMPQELLEKAECIIVFPSVLKAAFVVGGLALLGGAALLVIGARQKA